MRQELTFTLTIKAEKIVVHYWENYFETADYARFEFVSPYHPRRWIPVSETGYRTHFSPMSEVRSALSVEAYALSLAVTFVRRIPCRPKKDFEQLELWVAYPS